MEEERASRTAVLVCKGRAVADGRLAPGRFRDPIAAQFLTIGERAEVERARDDEPPADLKPRLAWERLRACAEGMAPRTVLIDEAVAAAGHPQLVIVGAGLDTRPWRLGELADTRVFSLDAPASQAECRGRAAGAQLAAPRTEFVPVRLDSQSLGGALAGAGHDASVPTTWLWEGVVPYLTPGQVAATVGALAERSAPTSTLVVHYQERSVTDRAGRVVNAFVARRLGLDNPLAEEPWRSRWTGRSLARLLGRHGFAVDHDEDLLRAARRIGSPTVHRWLLRNGRIAVAGRDGSGGRHRASRRR
jgi:methyltransferase (TIGR00027 family)